MKKQIISFIDDQLRKTSAGDLIILTAVVWDQSCLIDAREHWIGRVAKAINSEANVVRSFPSIHGSDMDKSLSREQKLSIFRAAADTITMHEADIFRIGYYTTPLQQFPDPKNFAFSLCMLGIVSWIQSFYSAETYQYVFEMNRTSHKTIDQSYNDHSTQYLRHIVGSENISIPNYEKIIGTFYSDKKNHFMYITDIFSFHYKKYEENNNGLYNKEIVDIFEGARARLLAKRYVTMRQADNS